MILVVFWMISTILNKIMMIVIHIFIKFYFIVENILESTMGLVNENFANFRTPFR